MKHPLIEELEQLRAAHEDLTDTLKRGQALNALTTVIFCAASFFGGMFAMAILTQLIGG